MTNPVFGGLAPAITSAIGTPITYTPPGGSEASLRAVWDDDFMTLQMAEGVEVEGRAIAAHIKKSDIASPVHDAAVVKGGVTYTVYQVEPNGPGMWTLLLGE